MSVSNFISVCMSIVESVILCRSLYKVQVDKALRKEIEANQKVGLKVNFSVIWELIIKQ